MGGGGIKEMKRTGPIDDYIARRMRERREKLGLTQQQLAERIGVTYQQQYKRERALNRISAAALYVTAEVLGVEIGWFFEGFDPKVRVRKSKPSAREEAAFKLMRTAVGMKPGRQDTMVKVARLIRSGDEELEIRRPSHF